MGRGYFDRYEQFRANGEVKPMPGIFLEPKQGDKQILYKLGKTRLDKVSQTYYNNPFHGWLILAANPQYGGLEFNIPDETVLTIPFPLNKSLEMYQSEVNKYIQLNGR
jgi:hypothetical protein